MVLSPDGMRELRSRISFTQLRFHCRKQQPGRTFHVKTAANSSGEAVARFFAGDTDVFPKACGSFEKLKGDNSFLASDCTNWGKENDTYRVGKWGHQGYTELYIFSAFISNYYHWATSPWQMGMWWHGEWFVVRWLLEDLCPLINATLCKSLMDTPVNGVEGGNEHTLELEHLEPLAWDFCICRKSVLYP